MKVIGNHIVDVNNMVPCKIIEKHIYKGISVPVLNKTINRRFTLFTERGNEYVGVFGYKRKYF